MTRGTVSSPHASRGATCQVTASLVTKLRQELETAKERERTAGSRKAKAIVALERALLNSGDPFKADARQLQRAVTRGIEDEAPADLVARAEAALVEVKRVRRRQHDALRAVLAQGGEVVPPDASYDELLAEVAPRLLIRATPAARNAMKSVMGLFTAAQRKGDGDPSAEESEAEAELARERAAIIIQRRVAPKQNLDMPALAQAVDDAREWRIPKNIIVAAGTLLEDAAGGSAVSGFARRLRAKSAESRERARVAQRVVAAREEAEGALGQMRLTRSATITLQGALDELRAACSAARRKQADPHVLKAGEAACAAHTTLLARRETAKMRIDRVAMCATPFLHPSFVPLIVPHPPVDTWRVW